MLDGEAVAHCLDGLPDFHRLLAGRPGDGLPLRLRPLWLEAQDLRGVELIGRRRMLQKALKKAGPALRFSEHMAGADGEAMFRHACAHGARGHRLEARHEPLQVGLVPDLGEGQEPGI